MVVNFATSGGGGGGSGVPEATVTCLVTAAVQMPNEQPVPVPVLLTSRATGKVPAAAKVKVVVCPLLVSPPGSVQVKPVGLPSDGPPSNVTGWPAVGAAGVTVKLAVKPVVLLPPPICTPFVPVAPEHPELVTVTVLLPSLDQVMLTALPVPLTTPPPVALQFQVAAGVQLLPEPVNESAWLACPLVGPLMVIDGPGGGGGGGGGGVESSTTMSECVRVT